MRQTGFRLLSVLSSILFLLMFSSCDLNGDGTSFKASGTFEATTVTLSSQVSGIVLGLSVSEGDHVMQGSPLLSIDDRELVIQGDIAKAQLRVAESQLALLEKGPRQEDRNQAARNAEAAKAGYDQAKSDFERIQKLFEKKSVTRKQYDDARSLLDIRKANYEGAKQVYEKLKRGSREEEIEIARAQRDQAAANVALINKKISDCIISAPLQATVTELLIEAGEFVTPGRHVVSLADLSVMKLKVYVQEERLQMIKRGQSVDVYIDARAEPLKGTITYISDVAEFTPKTIQTEKERVKLVFAVEIRCDNESDILKTGLPADAVFPIKPSSETPPYRAENE